MARVSGATKISDALRKLAEKAPQAATRALTLAALDVNARAVHMAPVETGHLRETGTTILNGVEVAHGTKDGGLEVTGTAPVSPDGVARAVVSFNATTADGKHSYAVIQHEETGFVHPLGGEAKFLEKALNQVESDFTKRIADVVKGGLLG